MKKLVISGACGRMGRMLAAEAGKYGFEVLAGVDPSAVSYGNFPVVNVFPQIREKPDLLIDFSVPATLASLLPYAISQGLPCVLGTTGYTEKDMEAIREASAQIAIFQSPNMSRGVYVLRQLAAKAAVMLRGYDIEIVEKHHNQKADSPSGTAYSLLEAVKSPDSVPVFGREGTNSKRGEQEIGIHAVRGGTVAGSHEVGFYGDNEVICLSHEAQGRGVFVSGALSAAAWLVNKPKGLYGMADLMEGKP